MTKVEIKFARSEQAEAFVQWSETSESFAGFGIMIAQESIVSRSVVAVFPSRRRADGFVTWFAFGRGLEEFKEYLSENETEKEFLVDSVEYVDKNREGMRIGIR